MEIHTIMDREKKATALSHYHLGINLKTSQRHLVCEYLGWIFPRDHHQIISRWRNSHLFHIRDRKSAIYCRKVSLNLYAYMLAYQERQAEADMEIHRQNFFLGKPGFCSEDLSADKVCFPQATGQSPFLTSVKCRCSPYFKMPLLQNLDQGLSD